MIGIRRLVILVGTLLAVTLGTSFPASAAFSASAAVPATTIATMVVAPPTSVVGKLACASTSTMSATWVKSTTPRISGYLVSVYFSDGLVQTVQLGATATSWSATINEYYVTAYSIQYTVTAQTDYGWTKESARTGSFSC
ncbi:MAG TPA: hypothetical protein VGN47_06610 [Blastococcus sp.]|jgi:hypothetical protein|nr:hypothetical protein [Blastococcus sp.]